MKRKHSGDDSTKTLFKRLTLKNISEGDPEEIIKLRKMLRSKDAARAFAEKSDFFLALICAFNKAFEAFRENKPTDLQDLLSILGNCCFMSITACLEVTRAHHKLVGNLILLLENVSLSIEAKSTILRLLSNLCVHKESALQIMNYPRLLDCVMQRVNDENESVSKAAFRVIRQCVISSFMKNVLASNGGYHLGNLLARTLSASAIETRDKEKSEIKEDVAEKKLVTEILQVLDALSHYSTKDSGRQLALSQCNNQFLKIYLDGNLKGGRAFILRLCKGSTHFRDALGEDGIFDKVLNAGLEGSELVKLLITFTQDAWGRARLRESHALDILVEDLTKNDDINQMVAIITSFRHYAHDRLGLAHLCRNPDFINTTVKHIQDYLAEYGEDCKISVTDEEEESFRPDSPLLLEIENKMSTKGKISQAKTNWSYSSSPNSQTVSPSYSGYSSPTRSPTSEVYSNWKLEFSPGSGAGLSPCSLYSSPTSSGSLSPLSNGFMSSVRSYSNSTLEDFGLNMEPASNSSDSRPVESKPDAHALKKQLIENELLLWTWQTQDDGNLPLLVREDVVICMINYIRHAPNNYGKVGKALTRIAGCRLEVGRLLAMHFHVRILHEFCFTACRVTRRARRCFKCERTNEIGREVLREFSRHVDSAFGRSALSRLSNDTKELVISSDTANVLFVKKNVIDPIAHFENIFKRLEEILSAKDFDGGGESYPGGPPIAWQLISTLSVGLPSTIFRDIFEIDAKWEPLENSECKVETNRGAGEDTPMITFVDEEANILAKVTLDSLCASSEYFMGMFSIDLVEKRTEVRKLIFSEQKDECAKEDFIIFLHFLAGCRNNRCTNVTSASTCSSLIQLADRYLSTSISKFLCLPHGPARRFLTGSTLPLFLKATLFTWQNNKLNELCLLTLTKLSKPDEVVSALQVVANNPHLITTFVSYLQQFLQKFSGIKGLYYVIDKF